MLKVKNTITEMKNVFDKLNSRLDMAKEKSFKTEKRKKTEKKTEQNIQESWDDNKKHNTCTMETPGGKKKRNRRNI